MSNIGNIFRSMQRPVAPHDAASTSGSRSGPSSPPATPRAGPSVPPQLAGLTPRLQRTPLPAADTGSDDEQEFFDAADHLAPAQPPASEIVEERPPTPPAASAAAPAAAAPTPRAPRRVSVADVAHTMQHPARRRESTQISSFFSRVQVKPGKGMQLPTSGPALAPAPAAVRGTPGAPPAGKPLDKGLLNGDHTKMLKTMRNAVTQIAPDLPKPALTGKPAEQLAALHDADAMRQHIAVLFGAHAHTLSAQIAGDSLTTALHAALQTPVPHPGPGPVDTPALSFPYSQHLMVGEHLAQACGGDACRAANALEVLRSGPQVSQMLHDLASGHLAEAPLDALRTATGMAQTAPGFRALMSMMQPPLEAERHAGFQRLLTAAGKVAEEGAAAHGASALSGAASRAALKVGGRHAQTTLAETVLNIEMRIHTAPHVAGANPYAALPPADKGAVFAWKQGFRASGPGTELSKVQGRLAKIGKYVARAAKHEKNSSVALNTRNPLNNGKFIKARAKMVAASVNQAFGRKKSPLTPLRAMGVNNGSQGHPDDNVSKLDSSVGTAMSELSTRLEMQLPAPGSSEHTQLVRNLSDARQPLPPQLERAALMNYVQGSMDQVRPLGHELGKEALMQVAIDIADQHGVPGAAQAIAAKLAPWEGKSVTLAHLKQWAQEGGVAEMQPAPAGASPTAQQETAFGKALRQASTLADPATDRPRDMTPEGAHHYVRTFVQEHTWGGTVAAASGGTIGVNLAPLSVPIKKLSGAVTEALTGVKASVAPVADVRATRSHTAVLGVGTSHHGGELFIGTQKQYAGGFGGGMAASVRRGLGSLFSVQGGGQATVTPVAGDKGYTRGVMVRAGRRENQDGQAFNSGAAREELTKFVDTMFAMAKGEGGGNLSPAATWEKIASEFLDSDTLSVGWQNQSSETLRHSGAGSVNARASVVAHADPYEAIGAGGSAGISVDWASAANNKRTENTGAVRMIRNNHLSRLQVNGTLGLTTTAPTIPVHDGKGTTVTPPGGGKPQTVGADPTSEALNLITPMAARQANYSLADKGSNVIFRSVVDAGRLSETYTLREVEHRDAQQFKALLTEPSRQAQFEKVFEAVHGPAEAKHELAKFVAKLDNWAGPGQHYTLRSRLRADVRKGLDESAALASAIHRRNPQDPALQQLSAHMMSKLSDENSWVPMQIQAYEAQTASDVAGLNFGAVATASHSVSSDRELYATAAPPNMVRAWAAQPLPPVPEHGPEGA